VLGFDFERGNQSRSSSPDPPYFEPLRFRVESKDLERVTFGNGLYVAVGLDGIFTSSNSTVWTKRIAATTYGFSDVAYSGGRFIATAFIDSKIFSSLNGILWTEKTIDTLSNTFPNLPPWGNAVCGSANGFLDSNRKCAGRID